MKIALYILILLAELVAGFLLVSLAWVNLSWIPCVIALAITATLLVLQIIKRAASRFLLKIALILLIPSAVAIIMFIWLIVGLMMVI